MYVINLKDSLSSDPSKVGNKAYNLAVLQEALCLDNVPISLVLQVHEQHDSESAMDEAVQSVGNSLHYPVIARSSTNVEDSAYSFAGLFVSEVCHSDSELVSTIQSVLDSPKSEAVIQYCAYRGVDHSKVKAAVLIQQYLSPQMAGVLFTKHPLTNDNSVAYIEYKDKSSDAVTAGSGGTKTLVIQKDQAATAQAPFGELISIGEKAEACFGYPVDMEWIFSDNKLWIVQVRQITA